MTFLLAAGSVALAQTDTLPAGLTQSGGVIMMQPVDSASESPSDRGPIDSSERRTGQAKFLSAADHDVYTRAFQAADRGDWVAARAIADQGHDATARQIVQWRYLLDKNSGATFLQIDAFLKANPNWPARDTLYARAEAAMDATMQPASIIAWFGARTPVSAMGKIRLGEAMIATSRSPAGQDMIRAAWIDGSFEPDQELAIVQRDGSLLTPETDRQRLNNLIWRDDTSGARRELARVTAEARRLAEARLALRSNPVSGQKLAAGLSGDLSADPDLLFDRARTARRAGDNDQAEALLLRAAQLDAGKNHPARLWAETNIVVREALKDGNYQTAYRILANSEFKSGDELSEAEFLAGWIALRFLHDPKAALPHFRRLEANVSRPISLARAYYWEGRASEAMGDAASAWQDYHSAARLPTTFYGQVALTRIDATPVLHVVDLAGDPSASKIDLLPADLLRAMQVLADLGNVNYLRVFAIRAEELHPDSKHVEALARALVDMGYRDVAVRVAKQASYSDILYLPYTHPTIPLPAYSGPGNGPEAAMVLGLIRQETEFDPDAVSGAGARGLMQIMPSTARHSAGMAGIPYRPNDLLSDPTYNVKLGMTEFGANLGDWGGSLILATAAYNAGPTNVKRWLVSNGDPRSPAVDPIDWIELIPFNETRNYVQRVLENTQIYRNRLAGRDQPLRILSDLYQPNAPVVKVIEYKPPPAPVPVPAPRPASGSGASG